MLRLFLSWMTVYSSTIFFSCQLLHTTYGIYTRSPSSRVGPKDSDTVICLVTFVAMESSAREAAGGLQARQPLDLPVVRKVGCVLVLVWNEAGDHLPDLTPLSLTRLET
jgi:hypothetical protein